MAATTTSPVKILLDLGYEIWEMEKDGYRSALMESINDLTRINPRDGRIAILIQALKNLKRAPDKPKINISKVLNKRITGADIKPADVDDSSTSSALVPDRLSNVADSVDSIALLLRRQFGVEKKQQRDDKKKQDKDNKDARENKLEKKPDKKTGLIPKAIAKPTLNFFEKLKTFFLNIAIGSAVYKMLDWLKDPANAEKISKFSDFLINNAGWILGGLAALALLPIVATIAGVVSSIISGLGLLGGLIPVLPLIIKGLLIAAGVALAVKVGQGVKRGVENIFTGGEVFSQAHDLAKSKLEAAGLQDLGKKWRGGGTPIRVKVSDNHHGTGRASYKTIKYENLNPKQKKAWDEYMVEKNRITTLKSEMKSQQKLLGDEAASSVEKSGVEMRKNMSNYGQQIWTQDDKDKQREKREEVEKKVRLNYENKVKSSTTNITNASIDSKNLKKETNISPPNTKGKGSTTIIDGGGGQQQSVGGGGGGINGTTPPSFPSQDPNNLGTFSTQGMYNMVG